MGKVGVIKGGGSLFKDSLEGSPVSPACAADNLLVRIVSWRPTGTGCGLCSLGLLPFVQPQGCAPELRLRRNSLKTASLYLCPVEHSESALWLISDRMSFFFFFISKKLKIVCFCGLVFNGLIKILGQPRFLPAAPCKHSGRAVKRHPQASTLPPWD